MFALVTVRTFGLPCRWLLRLTSLAADMAAGVRTTWLATGRSVVVYFAVRTKKRLSLVDTLCLCGACAGRPGGCAAGLLAAATS